ncbi:argonaute-like protein, partial [Mycena crocata]
PHKGTNITTVGVRRPDYGSEGQKFGVVINAFTAKIQSSTVYHYDGISTEGQTLSPATNTKLIDALQVSSPQIFGGSPVIFDGRRNLFATTELVLGESKTAEVCPAFIPKGCTLRRLFMKSANPIIAHKVQFRRNSSLQDFVDGNTSLDGTITSALMALNVALRMVPNKRYPAKDRSFFSRQTHRYIGSGLVLWRGYFQSVRPGMGQVLINVDIATGVMYRDGPLLTLCKEFLGCDPAHDLSDGKWELLSRFLIGLRVETSVSFTGLAEDPGRLRSIRQLSRGSAKQTKIFSHGEERTVAEYCTMIGGALKFPSFLCVGVRNPLWIPIEFCTIPDSGQLVKQEYSDNHKDKIISFSAIKPSLRLEAIAQSQTVLEHGQSEYVRQLGMMVSPSLLSTTARVLYAPALRYGILKPILALTNFMTRNRLNKQFHSPVTISTWVMVVLERGTDDKIAGLIRNFVTECEKTGDSVKMYRIVGVGKLTSIQGSHFSNLRLGLCISNPKILPVASLFVVILSSVAGNEQYTNIKRWGDIKNGFPTQCLRAKKCFEAKPQYWSNVALKVNAKLGGTNATVDHPLLCDTNSSTVVMGADVIHPGPGTNGLPSHAAVVCSMDLNAAKYAAVSAVQESRQELISDLKAMCSKLLVMFMERNAAKGPKRLLFYRDGVSEGQFQQVISYELPLLKAACAELEIAPAITLIVVGKRHHVRLFPARNTSGDRSGNCPAGTIVDTAVCHPTEFDFYLQSHAGLLGTSRPAHYSVRRCENHFEADMIQSVSFALCHVYTRSTRSISIPAPVYYADSVCGRAKNHYVAAPQEENGESETTAAEKLQKCKTFYRPVHRNLEGSMYFSVSLLVALLRTTLTMIQ